jgi:hypothetical protein
MTGSSILLALVAVLVVGFVGGLVRRTVARVVCVGVDRLLRAVLKQR